MIIFIFGECACSKIVWTYFRGTSFKDLEREHKIINKNNKKRSILRNLIVIKKLF